MKLSGRLFGALAAVAFLGWAGQLRAQTNVSFPDPNLEAAVRSALGVPTGPLTSDELGTLTSLYASWRQITNLSGLEYATNLTTLNLSYNSVSGVSLLAGLGHLHYLNLQGNPLGDAKALAGLTNLTTLYASSCSLSNMAFVAGLTQLVTLDLDANQIADLAPVLGLNSLQYLSLNQDRLTNITGLDALLKLQSVYLTHNLLNLSDGSPSLTVITNLQAHGVFVSCLPQNEPPTFVIPATWAVPMNRTSSLSLSVYDDVTAPTQLVVTVASANTNLVPAAELALQQFDSYGTWTLTLTPSTGQTGTTTLTITATDDTGFTATTNLPVTVFYTPPVSLPDTNLEAAVRNSLGLPTGPLTVNDLQLLTWLNASRAGISNLTGLEFATNLTAAYLSGNVIGSLSPLVGLPQLQTLDLGYNNLHGPSMFQGLTNLTTLTLDGNSGLNLADLGGLPNLAYLSTSSCSLSNLTGIGALTRLQSLSLGYNSLRDPSPLAALTNLVYLNLQGNPLAGTTGLTGLTKLVNLTLINCALSSLGGLHGLTKLQYLYLSHNAIRDLSPLASLTNLVYLTLDSNPISSVAALAALPRLATLTLMNCSLANLASAQGLTALRSLYLSNNGIRNLTPLAALTNLSTLYVGGNSPTNLAPLAGLAALSALDLASCSLSNVSALAPMAKLRSLNLSYDRLTDVSALLSMTNLYTLYLTANRLTNIAGLQNLGGLSGLDLTRNLLDVSAGSLALTTITNLQQQGAWVNYDPQNQPPVFYGLRTNWVIRPNTPSDLQFALVDDVTLADKVAVTITCASSGPLSNSAIALVRTSFVLAPGSPAPPILLPPTPILPAPPELPLPAPESKGLAANSSLLLPILVSGGGVSYWDLTATPSLNQTGTMTLTLTATDDTGLSTKANILVTVTPPQGLDGVFPGATNLIWQTGGNAPWFGQTNASQSGSFAAQSGPVGVGEESWLGTTVTGPGILTFWWRIMANYSSSVSFTTSRGGELDLRASSYWRKESVSIPAGECGVKWSYASVWAALPSEAGWVDQVSFVPTAPDFWVELASGPGATGTVATLHGEPGALYELQVATNLSNWSPLSRVVLDPVNGGFTASVTDPSAQAGARFYRARQLPADTTWFGPVTFNAAGSPVLQLYSRPGTACEIQASPDLATWTALATVTNTTGTTTFTDGEAALARRFYQARQVP